MGIAEGFVLKALLIGLGIFFGMLGALALGQRIARTLAKRGIEAGDGAGAMNGAVFALLGLLIAFTFSGAATRFEARRSLLVEEANAIGTAYLRLDLVKPEARTTLQEMFRTYVDTRLAQYQVASVAAFRAKHVQAQRMQGEIWSLAVRSSLDVGTPAPQVLLPALNEMIDITTTRAVAIENHPPSIIYAMLILLALAAALVAGLGLTGAHPHWAPKIAFAAAIATTIYITLDIEHPRLGLVIISEADQILRDVRASMK